MWTTKLLYSVLAVSINSKLSLISNRLPPYIVFEGLPWQPSHCLRNGTPKQSNGEGPLLLLLLLAVVIVVVIFFVVGVILCVSEREEYWGVHVAFKTMLFTASPSEIVFLGSEKNCFMFGSVQEHSKLSRLTRPCGHYISLPPSIHHSSGTMVLRASWGSFGVFRYLWEISEIFCSMCSNSKGQLRGFRWFSVFLGDFAKHLFNVQAGGTIEPSNRHTFFI